MNMKLKDIEDAITEDYAAFSCRAKLQPIQGEGGRVRPPTYAAKENGKEHSYAYYQRRIKGESITCVDLDSIPSQANRIEDCFQQLIDEGLLKIPHLQMIIPVPGRTAIKVTSLNAPHRTSDSHFWSGKVEGTTFFKSEVGQDLVKASPRDASALLKYGPLSIVLGCWNSGPKGSGSHQSKFERCLTSEIIAVNPEISKQTAIRLDPFVENDPTKPLYKPKNPDDGLYVLDPSKAEVEKGKPVLVGSDSSKKEKGRPSNVVLGSIISTPSVHVNGITADYYEHHAVLSLTALKRSQFPSLSKEEQTLAWTYLAALGVCGAVLMQHAGYHLRTGTDLLPVEPLTWVLKSKSPKDPEKVFEVSKEDALGILKEVSDLMVKSNIPWRPEPLDVSPTDDHTELVSATFGASEPETTLAAE